MEMSSFQQFLPGPAFRLQIRLQENDLARCSPGGKDLTWNAAGKIQFMMMMEMAREDFFESVPGRLF